MTTARASGAAYCIGLMHHTGMLASARLGSPRSFLAVVTDLHELAVREVGKVQEQPLPAAAAARLHSQMRAAADGKTLGRKLMFTISDAQVGDFIAYAMPAAEFRAGDMRYPNPPKIKSRA